MTIQTVAEKAGDIPKGLATKLGQGAATLGLLLAIVLEATGTNLDPDTLKVAGAGWIALLITMAGRFAQAYAKYRDAPGLDGGLLEDIDELPVDTDESLSAPEQATPGTTLRPPNV